MRIASAHSAAAENYFAERGVTTLPKLNELRNFLTQYFGQVHNSLRELGLYQSTGDTIVRAAQMAVEGQVLNATDKKRSPFGGNGCNAPCHPTMMT